MATCLAVQFNERVARVVLAELHGRDVTLRRVEELRLSAGTDSSSTSDAREANRRAGERLDAALALVKTWRVGKTPVVVVLDRAACELRVLDVPPVPEDELPDIVRFQAMQQFAALHESATLDFVPLPPSQKPRVLAAAFSADKFNSIRDRFKAAEIGLSAIVLGSCGTTSIVDQTAVKLNGNDARWIVELDEESVAIHIACGAQLLLTRVIPVSPSSPADERKSTIITGLRRTLAAAQSQFEKNSISQGVICGDTDFHQELAQECRDSLRMPIECVRPLAACRWSREAEASVGSEAMTSIVGAMVERNQPQAATFDFLQPRRPPVPKDHRTTWLAVAAVTLACGFLGAVAWWWGLSTRDANIAKLRLEVTEMDKLVAVADQQQKELDQLDEWYDASPNWLLELSRLSQKLPPAEKLRLERLQADVVGNDGGRVMIKGYVDESATVTGIETRLRDKSHQVEGIDRNFVGSDPKYPWFFAETIRVRGTVDEPPSEAPQ